MALNVALRPGKTELMFRQYLIDKLNGMGGPVVGRDPDADDRGDQWIRIQAMPYHQVNEIEFENPAMVHVYDLDEDRGLETIDQIGAYMLVARQIFITVGGLKYYVSGSGIDIGYTKREDPELIDYTRYIMTSYFVTKGIPLV